MALSVTEEGLPAAAMAREEEDESRRVVPQGDSAGSRSACSRSNRGRKLGELTWPKGLLRARLEEAGWHPLQRAACFRAAGLFFF